MGEQGYQDEVDSVRRERAADAVAGERAVAQDEADRAEFAAFAAWLTDQAEAAGWDQVPFPMCQARTVRTGFAGRASTVFDVVDHPDVRGLQVTEPHPTMPIMDGQSWLVTRTGQVYHYDANGWFEESHGPPEPVQGPEELRVQTRLRPLLLNLLAHHQDQGGT